MVELETISITLPLLFLVVLKLCDIAREIDLKDAPEGGSWSSASAVENSPYIGPFTQIHGINYLALMFIQIGLTDLYAGNPILDYLTLQPSGVLFYLWGFSFLIWIMLPIFEVKGYSRVQKTGLLSIPRSLMYHFVIVVLNTLFIWFSSPHRQLRPDAGSLLEFFSLTFELLVSNPGLVIADLVIGLFSMLIIVLGIFVFPTQLDDDFNLRYE